MTSDTLPETTGGGILNRARQGLALLAAVITLVLIPTGGPGWSYAVALLLLVSLVLFDRSMLAAGLRDRGVQLFVVAFGLIAIAFVITAQTPRDYLTVFDFSGFALILVAYALFRRSNLRQSPVVFAAIALVAVAAIAARGWYEIDVLHEQRAGGQANPIFFSDIAILVGFLALGGLFTTARFRFVFLVGPLLGALGAAYGGSRGALIVALVLLAVFVGFALRSFDARRVLLASVAVVALAVAAIAFAGLANADRFTGLFGKLRDLLTSGNSGDDSIALRLQFYRGGILAFLDSPAWGHGWLRRFSAAAKYFTDSTIGTPAPSVAHLHNDIINFASAAGVLGVGSYLLAIAAPVVSVLRSGHDENRTFRLYAAMVVSIGYFAMGLTDVMFVYEAPKTMYCLLAAMTMAMLLPPATRRAA